MMTLAERWFQPAEREVATELYEPPRADWALMCDVASFRAGVPEALIARRRAEGDTPPEPML